MAHNTDDLEPSGAEKFESAQQYLLPNEEVQLVCQTQKGFLVLSSRRITLLKEESRSKYRVEKVIPYDCILGFESKKAERVEISGIALDRYGRHTKENQVFEVKAPRAESGENKTGVRSRFQSTMSRCFDVVKEVRESQEFTGEIPPARDYSYLEIMPESLTRNAILDLNTILRDQPIHDLLDHEAVKILGNKPFLLEESLRDGTDKDNGVLFAAGTKGYFWIQGKKNGRFMTNVIVDTIEWDNIRVFANQWHRESAIINTAYTLTKDGNETTSEYLWSPSTIGDTHEYPWLLQELNGPWILADIMYKHSGKPMPASWLQKTNLKKSELHNQRFYH